jgi:hypothetical protein
MRLAAATLLALGLACVASCGDDQGGQTLLTGIAPGFLSVDETSFYWKDVNTTTSFHTPIHRVSKQSPTRDAIEDLGDGAEPVVVGGVLYAAVVQGKTRTVAAFRAPGAVTTIGELGAGAICCGSAADSTNFYYSMYTQAPNDPGRRFSKIWAQPLTGGAPVLVATDDTGQTYEIAAAGGELFWTADLSATFATPGAKVAGAVWRATLTNALPVLMFQAPTLPAALVSGGPFVYWVATALVPGGGTEEELIQLDRADQSQRVLAVTTQVSQLAADQSGVVWREEAGDVFEVRVADGTRRQLGRVPNGVSMALDAQFAYVGTFVYGGDGSLIRLER